MTNFNEVMVYINIPENKLVAVNNARLDLLSHKSKIYYKMECLQFCEWQIKEQVQGPGKTVIGTSLFKETMKQGPKYSMLRITPLRITIFAIFHFTQVILFRYRFQI